MHKLYLYSLFFILGFSTSAQTISGELKKWHTLTLEFTDDETYTETGSPDVYKDRRLNVTFTSPTGNSYLVPGYFAADGNAAETSAVSGNKFHVKFTPDEVGQWSYVASFREGTNVAVIYPASETDGNPSTGIDGLSGNFSISATDKTGIDFRGKGRAKVVGGHYLQFAETGGFFIKGGADSPENLLAFNDFDDVYNTGGADYRKDFATHVSDWQSGDPVWQSTKGKGLIGVINYFADDVEINSISFLTMNKNQGDTKDVSMWVETGNNIPVPNYEDFDVSRLAQWEIIFEFAQTKGIHLHFKTQEQENVTQLDNGSLGTERKLYYRELIARFGHHLVLNWNMGEEIGGNSTFGTSTIQDIKNQLKYVKDLDPYNHLRVVHTFGTEQGQDTIYNNLLGSQSDLTGISLQDSNFDINIRVKHWKDQSIAAGKPYPISSDETSGTDVPLGLRRYQLYGSYFAGGHGVEVYFSGEDFDLENFRTYDEQYRQIGYAIDFMQTLPFTEMTSDNGITDLTDDYVFRKNADTYVVYRYQNNFENDITLPNTGDRYTIKWFDVRNGGPLVDGTISTITGDGTSKGMGLPPTNTTDDWVALLKNNSSSNEPNLFIEDATIIEGEIATLNITLDKSVSGGFTVDYITADNSATAPSDYTTTNGTLTFVGTAGETQIITINTIDDSLVEANEVFFVDLSNATNGVNIADPESIVTIIDNDFNANVSIDDVMVTEGNDAVFTVTLDNNYSGGFTLDYSTVDLSATSGEDYTTTTGTLTFAGTAGETQTITINTIDDAIVENNESFSVILSTSSSVNLSKESGECTIADNDAATSITIDDLTVAEGNNAVFTVSLDNAVSGGFTVDFATANNSAVAGQDYTANAGTLTFTGTAGETQTITIATTDDALVESNEDFFVNLTNATNGVTIADAQGTATILDNDVQTNISIDDITLTEGNNAVFTVSLDNTVSGGFTVDFATANNSAVAGEDYTTNAGTLTFTGTAGETQTITIATIDDALVESNEDFFVNLTNATNNVTIADTQGTATILDNDAVASIFIDDITVTEGNNAVFTVSLDNAVSGGFTIDFTTANNSAVAGEDYTTNTGTLTFTGTTGETQTITITTMDDTLVESNEDFFVNLTNATNNVTIADVQGTATILDNDVQTNISIDDITITEGNNAVFTVTVDNAVSGGFTVDFATANNSAVAGEDYTANTGTLTFTGTAGETQTITIATIDDGLVESNEDFFVNLTNATNNVTIADAQGTATITDNDAAASITIDDLTVAEGNNAVFTVTVDNAVSGGFTIDFATANNSAVAGEDYTTNTGTLTFTGTVGETQTITIATIDDGLAESNEDFFVNLTNATNNVTIADAQGIAVIIDNLVEQEGSIKLYPIPLERNEQNLFIENLIPGEYFFRIFSLTGTLLIDRKITTSSNIYDFSVNNFFLSTGVYILYIESITDNRKIAKKVIIR